MPVNKKKNDTEYTVKYYNIIGPMINMETYRDMNLEIAEGGFCWYDEKGHIDNSGFFKNNKKDGRWEYFGDSIKLIATKIYSNDSLLSIQYPRNKMDTLPAEEKDSTQKEATFKNGIKGWNTYIERNLEIPERFSNNLKLGTHTITVCFLINKSGYTEDVYLKKSVEWSADREVLRILEKSPAWIPAVQKGKKVYYRQIQSISMKINK